MALTDIPDNEGQWEKRQNSVGVDSALFGNRNNNNRLSSNIVDLKLGTVLIPQPEPVFKETSISVSLNTGGTLTNVAWPGPQVDMNPTGIIPGGLALGIHGFWEAPLSGQQVLVGFVEGSSQNPVVLQKYPYNASHRPDLEFLHFLPMAFKLIGPTDVVMGQHVGSRIILRGTFPIPGQIDIFAISAYTLTTLGIGTVTIGGAMIETVGGAKTLNIGGAYNAAVGGAMLENVGGAKTVTVGGAVSITAGAAVSINAGAVVSIAAGGLVSLVGIPGVNINAGIFPAAAVGDLVTTLLGPSPVLPGPGRVPTSLTIT